MTREDARFLLDMINAHPLNDGITRTHAERVEWVETRKRIRRELAKVAAKPETVAETKAAMLAKLDASWPEVPQDERMAGICTLCGCTVEHSLSRCFNCYPHQVE